AEPQRIAAEADSAIERSYEFWREALHRRIGDGRQAIGYELGTGQHVPQVVVDLAYRQPDLRKSALLLKHLRELPLHSCELPLGDANLVPTLGRNDDAARVLRILAESEHVVRNPHHRAHEHG